MFRSILKFRTFISKPTLSFTTIPILQTNLGLFSQNSSKVVDSFITSQSSISHQELLTYIGFFSLHEMKSPNLWEAIHSKLQSTLDQFSLSELAQLSSFVGSSKQFDDSFWKIMEGKFMENLFVDEDNHYILPMFLKGFANRRYKVSESFAYRLLNYLESIGDEIKGNDLTSLTYNLMRMKPFLNEVRNFKPLMKKFINKSLQEINYLDFTGLAYLTQSLLLSEKMTSDLQKKIIENLNLVENTMTSEGIQLLFDAFNKTDVFLGNLGRNIMSFLLNNSNMAHGKQFAFNCFTILKNNVDDPILIQSFLEQIKEDMDLFDGKDSIKIAFCCVKINLREFEIVKKLRENVFQILDEITGEELLWVYEGFQELIPQDQEFWNKVDIIFKELLTNLDEDLSEKILKAANKPKKPLGL